MMGFAAEWELSGAMRRGQIGSGYPKGWMSEKKPCPVCAKGIAGRDEGMTDHIRKKHSWPKQDAQSAARKIWYTEKDDE